MKKTLVALSFFAAVAGSNVFAEEVVQAPVAAEETKAAVEKIDSLTDANATEVVAEAPAQDAAA